MSDSKDLSRRRLLTYGAAVGASVPLTNAGVLANAGGLASAVGLAAAVGLEAGTAEGAPAQVPRRVLGKTGQSIPILLVGGGAGFKGGVDPRITLALRHGANYIDTARKYAGGASERNAGAALAKLKARDNTWLTSKTPQWSAAGLKQDVAFSLAALQTDRIDLYFLHGLDQLDPLNDKELIKAAEGLKREKKIRFFGFSCHGGNVVELLQAAAQRSFVDAVMFRYNFRDYGDKELNRAIDAAHKAGVGLIAMKTQGSESGFRDAWTKFEQTGKWNKHQAVLKAVWADPRITAAVSHMETTAQMRENLAAALDGKPLGQRDTEAVERYAELTRGYACRGCEHLCNPHVDAPVRIGTTLRCLMYHDSYGDSEKARRVFRELPAEARQLEGVDFSSASRACPHGIDIEAQMQRARELFA